MSRKLDIFLKVIDIWSTTQDIDGVLDHLSDDIVWHYSAVTKPPKVGKAGAREFLEAFAGHVRNPRWRIFDYAERGNTLFVEGVDDFDTPDGKRIITPYMGVYEFDGDLICGWRDYFDRGVADAGAKGEALPDFAVALIDRSAITAGNSIASQA